MSHCILKTDGGARGNPGPAGAGFVLENDGGLVRNGGRFLGEATNNVAEYEALLWGLENALDYGCGELDAFLDSELIVKQLNGEYKVKHPNLKPLYERARILINRFGRVNVRHIPREENSAADALANQAMDLRATVGDAMEPTSGPSQQSLFSE